MMDDPKPLDAKEVVKVFIIIDSDFPDYHLYVPHTLRGLKDAMESVFCDDAIIEDYDCDGDHYLTVKHAFISKSEFDAMEAWEPG